MHPERAQQLPEHVPGIPRPVGCTIELRPQLPVRKQRPHNVPRVHHQCGLPRSRQAADHNHRHPSPVTAGSEHRLESGHLIRAASEIGHCGRQLERPGHQTTLRLAGTDNRAAGNSRAGISRGRGQIVPQHPRVRTGQARSRQDTKLVIEPAPRPLIHLQRGGLLATAGQCDHQARMGTLIQRVTPGQGMQMRQHPVMPALRRRHLRVLHHYLSPLLHQAHHSRMTLQQRHIRQRLTLPQAQSPFEQLTRPSRIPRPPRTPGTLSQPAEHQQVKIDTSRLHPVPNIRSLQQATTTPTSGPPRIQDTAEPADMRLDHRPSRGRQLTTPQHLTNRVQAHRRTRMHRRQPQDRLLLTPPQRHHHPTPPRHQRTKHPKTESIPQARAIHTHTGPRSLPRSHPEHRG